MDQPNCWDLSSLPALAASIELEASELRNALPALKGRAWMLVSWRASSLDAAAVRLRSALDGAAGAHEMTMGLHKHGLMAPADVAGLLHRLFSEQEAGRWHNAFALGQHLAHEIELRAAIGHARGATARREHQSQPPQEGP